MQKRSGSRHRAGCGDRCHSRRSKRRRSSRPGGSVQLGLTASLSLQSHRLVPAFGRPELCRWHRARSGIFGEMALIDDEPRSATAVAITDVELVPVSVKQFLFLVRHTPYFALKVMRVLAQRLRVTNKSLD